MSTTLSPVVSARKADTLRHLPLSQLHPSAHNPRSLFEADALDELTESIKEHGLLEPLVVRPMQDDYYVIIAGERRYRACKMLGLPDVPCVVRRVDSDREALVLTITENLHRRDLNVIEIAAGYRLLESLGYKQERIAQLVGGSVPGVSNTLRLLRLPDTVQAMIARGDLTRSHGLLLLPLVGIKAGSTKAEQEAPCLQMAEWCVQQHWSTKRLETQIEADYARAKAAGETLPLDVPEDTQGARFAPPGPVPDPLTREGDNAPSAPPRLYPDGFRFRDYARTLVVVTGPAVNNELDGSQSYAVEWLNDDGKRIVTGRMSEASITSYVQKFPDGDNAPNAPTNVPGTGQPVPATDADLDDWEKGYYAPTAVGEPDIPATDDEAPGEAVELPNAGGAAGAEADLAGDDQGQPDEPRPVPSAQASAPGVGHTAAPGVADALAPQVLPAAVSVAPATVTVAPDFRTAFDSLLGELRVFLAQMHQGYGKRDGNKIGRAYVCEKVKEIIAHYDEGGAKPPFIASPFAPGQPVEVERPGGWVPAKVTDAQTIHGKEVVSVAVEGEVGFAIQRADQVRPVTPAEPSTPPPVNRTAFLPPDTLAAFTDPAINASGQIGGKNGKVAHPITFEGDLWAVVSTSFLPGGGREAMACRLVPRAEWTGPINEHKQSGNTYYGMPVKTPAGDFVLSGEYVDFEAEPCPSHTFATPEPAPAPPTGRNFEVGARVEVLKWIDFKQTWLPATMVRSNWNIFEVRVDGRDADEWTDLKSIRPLESAGETNTGEAQESVAEVAQDEDAAECVKCRAVIPGRVMCEIVDLDGAFDRPVSTADGTTLLPGGKLFCPSCAPNTAPAPGDLVTDAAEPDTPDADAYTPREVEWDREEVPV